MPRNNCGSCSFGTCRDGFVSCTNSSAVIGEAGMMSGSKVTISPISTLLEMSTMSAVEKWANSAAKNKIEISIFHRKSCEIKFFKKKI